MYRVVYSTFRVAFKQERYAPYSMDSIHCVKYWHLPASYFSHISETFYFSLFDIKHVLFLAFDITGCLRFSDFDITAALFGNNARRRGFRIWGVTWDKYYDKEGLAKWLHCWPTVVL